MGSVTAAGSEAGAGAPPPGGVEVLTAPSNLGLRPPAPGREPGVWRAPRVRMSQGLGHRLNAARIVSSPAEVRVPGTAGHPDPQRDRNPRPRPEARGCGRHRARRVAVRGRCGRRLQHPAGLPGGCAAGWALRPGARRRPPRLLTIPATMTPRPAWVGGRHGPRAGHWPRRTPAHPWPVVGKPLVHDGDVIQIGDREPAETDWPDGRLSDGRFRMVLRAGLADGGRPHDRAPAAAGLDRVWLHVDLDVLDQRELPAVDTPGSPGLTFGQLGQLLSGLVAAGCVVGLDVTIYDPELDPAGEYAPRIVDCLASALAPLTSTAAGKAST